MAKTFNQIVETVMGRFNGGGYLPGMYVKFRPEYKSCDCYKAMPSDMRQSLDDLIKTGYKLKVLQVGDNLSGHSAGNQFKTANVAVITIAADQGAGHRSGSITVTPEMIDVDEEGFKLPDEFVKDYTKPFEMEEFFPDTKHPSRLTDKGNKKNTPTSIKLGESSSPTKDLANLALLMEGKEEDFSKVYEEVLTEGFIRRLATKFAGGRKSNPLQLDNKAHQFAKSVAYDVGKDISKSFGGNYTRHAKVVYDTIINYVKSVAGQP